MGQLFGTDGVRGVANHKLTPELAFRLGRAVAYKLANKGDNPTIAIGKDTRISGDLLECALTAGICSAGVNVYRLGVVPTPAIAYLTRKLKATAGAVISASHNPVEDNGIKFFDEQGFKLDDDLENEIEAYVLAAEDKLPRPTGIEVGRVINIEDASDLYVEYALSMFPLNLKGLKLVIDCANGASYKVAPQVLRQLGAEIICINNIPDGTNINANCGSTHPESLQESVVKYNADLGLAFDGDADRVLAVDEQGHLVDGDQIIVMIALALQKQGNLANDLVVVTVMSNLGLFLALKKAGLNVAQTKVGDRYVLEELVKSKGVLGGEQSGHIILLDKNTTGDGLMTSLQILQVIVTSKQSLGQLSKQMDKLPQTLVNVLVEDKEQAMKNELFLAEIKKAEVKLEDRGRILVRPSGTESLIRIMGEGPDLDELNTIVESLAKLIEK